jgi:SSS family solute:Na+ symporter
MVNVVFGWTDLHFLYVAPILTALDLGLVIAVSKASKVELSAGSAATMWTRDFSKSEHLRLQRTPAWQDYRIQSVVLLILTGIIVYWFR